MSADGPPRAARTMMERLRFEEPHAGLEASYRGLVREFVERGELLIPFPLRFPHDVFALFPARLAANARGEVVRRYIIPIGGHPEAGS